MTQDLIITVYMQIHLVGDEIMINPSFHNVISNNFSYAIASINSTCIPSVGIFHFNPEFKNYLNASLACNNSNGLLAHVLSEARTEKISKFLNQSSIPTSVAFIGLNETKSYAKFLTSTQEPIQCFRYRAWAPGHPMYVI